MISHESSPAAPRPEERAEWHRLVPGLLLAVHAAVILVPRIPLTLVRLWRAFRPTGAVTTDDFLAFSPIDGSYRSWYAKLSRDMARVGRRGIVWNDAYGLPLNQRFYNNLATYRLYGTLGARGAALLGLVFYLGAVMVLFALRGRPLTGLVTAVLLVGSPILLGSQLHRGKPEMMWWGAMPLLVFAAGTGHYLVAGALFSALALVNFSVAFFAGLTLVAVLVALLLAGDPVLDAAAWIAIAALPGLAKTLIRLVPFIRRGFLPKLLKEQDDATAPVDAPTARLRALLAPSLLLHVVLLTVAFVLVAPDDRLFWATLAGIALAAQCGSQTVLYVADPQSFWLWHLSIVVAMLASRPSWLGVLGIVVLAYPHPAQAGFPLSESMAGADTLAARLRRRADSAWRDLRQYPGLQPMSRTRTVEPLEVLFRPVPDGSRIIMEMRRDDRTLGGYRSFITLSEDVLPRRGIELLPDEYVRVDTPRHFRRHGAFNETGPDELLEALPRRIGASYALAYTPGFVTRLSRLGFVPVAELPLTSLSPTMRVLLQLPSDHTLVLLRHPVQSAIIDPPVALTVEPDALHWVAEAGVRYVARYAARPQLRAFQGSRQLSLADEPAEEGSDLRFMSVTALESGPLRIEYREGWL